MADDIKCRERDALNFRKADISNCRGGADISNCRAGDNQVGEMQFCSYFFREVIFLISHRRVHIFFSKEWSFEFPIGGVLIFARRDILNCQSAIFLGKELQILVRQCSHFFRSNIILNCRSAVFFFFEKRYANSRSAVLLFFWGAIF